MKRSRACTGMLSFENDDFQILKNSRGGGGGRGTLIFSYIRRLGSFFGVQNLELHYFGGFSEK